MNDPFFTPHNVEQFVGRTFTSGWHPIDQRRISVFGANTDDLDPHHMDPLFAARHGAFGKPISYGFLTLSMMTAMLYQVNRYPLPAGCRCQHRLAAGLLTPQALERLLADALKRQQAADSPLAIAERVAAAGIEPMSMEEINAVVKAARAERRQRAGGH
jgi:hypothetical protein